MNGIPLNDRYRLDAEIGRGGMGVVYRAHDTLLGRDVALKVLSSATLDSKGCARLLREAQATAQLNHPNVVSVYDAGEADDGTPYIVMELVEGESLQERPPDGLEEILSTTCQICAALEHAHTHGIIHRDLKPANVLAKPDGSVKLVDFGLARIPASRLTGEETILGTVFYLAPEQATGAEIDARGDLYALGVMLYEWTTGQLPFGGDDPLVVLSQHLKAPVVPPSTHAPQIPPALDRLIVRLLSKRPGDRPASAAEVGEALGDLLGPEVTPGTLRAPPKAVESLLHNLPAPITPFVGRETQLAEVREMLSRPEVRLLTLTGVGGTGKTRLALQVAAEVAEDYADGVYFVPLAPIRDPALVVPTIAATLGVRESGDTPLLKALQYALRDRERLLVIDNFEQLIEAAPSVGGLVATASRLKVLVTSRAPLHVYGEHEYPVPPMEVPHPRPLALSRVEGPSLDRLGQADAVSLFVQGAQRVQPSFSLSEENAPAVAEICALLDGLPLAIELAAARVKLFSPQAMLAHVRGRPGGANGRSPGHSPLQFLTGGPRDMPARQRTLRATIEWSHDLLDADEQALFQRLSVFAGGCTLDAVDAVCIDPSSAVLGLSSLDLLQSLIDQNVLQVSQVAGGPRFSMLETVREYATERLAESEEAEAIRQQHARYFLALAEEAEAGHSGPKAAAWIDRLEREYDNLRAALAWSIKGAGEIGLRLAGALRWFWDDRVHNSEGRDWLAQALAAGAAGGPELDRWRAKALTGAGWLAHLQGDERAARTFLSESVALCREFGEARGLAWALGRLALVVQDHDRAYARSLLEETIALFRQLADRQGLAAALVADGSLAEAEGDYERARASIEEGVAFDRASGGSARVAWGAALLGRMAFAQGDCAAARSWFQESLALYREVKDKPNIAAQLANLASIGYLQGDYGRAGTWFRESLQTLVEVGNKSRVASVLAELGYVASRQGRWEEARARLAEALALCREAPGMAERGIVACALGGAGRAEAEGQPERAARLLGAVEAAWKRDVRPLTALCPHVHGRLAAAVRAQLGERAFESAWAERQDLEVWAAANELLAELAEDRD